LTDYRESNRRLWNDWTALHEQADTYDLVGFRAGKSSLKAMDVEALGAVAGKSLLHLQCHFGKDTLSWARLGATVTGVDFADRAIALAQSLSAELDIPARFVLSDVYEAPAVIREQFDLVYTSVGVLGWLGDLPRWGAVVAGFLKPGGVFYIREIHPFSQVFEDPATGEGIEPAYGYATTPEPMRFDVHGSYAAPDADYHSVEYSWNHSLGEIVTALTEAGLVIEWLREYPFTDNDTQFRALERRDDGWSQFRDPRLRAAIPLMFALRAHKPD
jgi:SAM-dependent methyltransferase